MLFLYVHHISAWCPWRSKGGTGVPATEAAKSREAQRVEVLGATPGPLQSRMCSCSLSHLTSPFRERISKPCFWLLFSEMLSLQCSGWRGEDYPWQFVMDIVLPYFICQFMSDQPFYSSFLDILRVLLHRLFLKSSQLKNNIKLHR